MVRGGNRFAVKVALVQCGEHRLRLVQQRSESGSRFTIIDSKKSGVRLQDFEHKLVLLALSHLSHLSHLSLMDWLFHPTWRCSFHEFRPPDAESGRRTCGRRAEGAPLGGGEVVWASPKMDKMGSRNELGSNSWPKSLLSPGSCVNSK